MALSNLTKTLTIMLSSGGEKTRKYNSGPPERMPITVKDFPDQPIEFKGKIVAITKIDNSEGISLKISLNCGTYIEMNCGNDIILFGRLCKMYELGKKMKITIE
jgi:hypothetical protein